jgi:hypothetical protein
MFVMQLHCIFRPLDSEQDHPVHHLKEIIARIS